MFPVVISGIILFFLISEDNGISSERSFTSCFKEMSLFIFRKLYMYKRARNPYEGRYLQQPGYHHPSLEYSRHPMTSDQVRSGPREQEVNLPIVQKVNNRSNPQQLARTFGVPYVTSVYRSSVLAILWSPNQ